ncbi:prolyl oligopeptidase family serine peptidase, partial [bacterium]|nr:prolyl oligopeptidase family serine peptidase [bacterium]
MLRRTDRSMRVGLALSSRAGYNLSPEEKSMPHQRSTHRDSARSKTLPTSGACGGRAPAPGSVRPQETPNGIRYGLWGPRRRSPAPTLLVLGADLATTLTNRDFNGIGHRLARRGYLSVGIDIPCHGAAVRPGEPEGLPGWHARLEAGDNFVQTFNRQVRAVVDNCIRHRLTDPKRIAIAGTSRGGFLGLQVMAADRRIRCGVAFAPVAVLPRVREFNDLENHRLTRALDLANVADKLAGRPIWICIGNNDERVGVDSVIAFARRVVAAYGAPGKIAPLELHVMPTDGHAIHPTAQAEAAAWVAK